MLCIDEFEGNLSVGGDTYYVRDALKNLPGNRWDPDSKRWLFPRTVTTYQMLTAVFPEAEVRSTVVDLEKKVQLLDEAMAAKTANDLPQPTSLTKAWAHQLAAYWFAVKRMEAQGGAMLALDMGCGKSKVAIDIGTYFNAKKIIITCPTSVMDVWPEEFRAHYPWDVEVHLCDRKHSIERRTKEAEEFLSGDANHLRVVVVNHEAIWRKPFGDWALAAGFNMIIVDESHRAKSAGGKLSRYLGRWPNLADTKGTYRIALTGTPCPHSIDDMYGQARFIDPSVWGTNHQVYKSQYMIMGGYGKYKVIGFKNQDDWNRKFHDIAIQVKADDALDLPEAVHTTRYCDLDDDERRAYVQMKEDFVADVKNGVITASNALVKLLRLAQIVQGTVTDQMGDKVIVGDSKARLLEEVLTDEIQKDEPVVVFCRFKCDLENIRMVCSDADRECYELSGDENRLRSWKQRCNDGVGAVLAVQIQAGGVGISMVQAKYCIYMSKDFSLGNYEQSLARVQRPGQKRNVTYIHLVARGTIDEVINKALAERKDTVETIIGWAGR